MPFAQQALEKHPSGNGQKGVGGEEAPARLGVQGPQPPEQTRETPSQPEPGPEPAPPKPIWLPSSTLPWPAAGNTADGRDSCLLPGRGPNRHPAQPLPGQEPWARLWLGLSSFVKIVHVPRVFPSEGATLRSPVCSQQTRPAATTAHFGALSSPVGATSCLRLPAPP